LVPGIARIGAPTLFPQLDDGAAAILIFAVEPIEELLELGLGGDLPVRPGDARQVRGIDTGAPLAPVRSPAEDR
jgi:hypothetical protein